jgi:parvulin-like peptidyl-prolyl isomerase
MKSILFFAFLCWISSCELTDEINEEQQEIFLEQNAEKPNVLVTDSGLQYEILVEGNGPNPKLEENVVVYYEGKLLDGTVFDSNLGGETRSFSPKQVIPGWREGLQLMSKGAKFILYIPSKLGYGSRSLKDIPANSLLIFEVELVDITEPTPEHWAQQLIMQPVVGPIKVLHVIIFILYAGFKFYRSGPSGGARCKASHILVKEEKTAREIKKRLDKLPKVSAGDFGKEAGEHSTCPSKSAGGSLGTFGPGDMVPAFDKVCFDPKTKESQVLGPVKTKFGWHLIYIEERQYPETKKSK